MSCSKCKSKTPCGCEDTSLPSGVVCATEACPNPDECPETFSAACTVWTGNDLICNSTVVARAGMRMDAVISNMIALFCGPNTPPQQGLALSLPTPNGVINGVDDIEICVDRNNCFDDLVVSVEAGGPAGITFSWTVIAGDPQSGTTTMTIEDGRSCLLFSWNNATLPQGINSFNFIITGCGEEVTIPVYYNKP